LKINIIITGLLFLACQSGFSQTDSTAYQKFFAEFLAIYKDFSKPPFKNYYQVISNTAKFSFTTSDPLFVNALAETAEKNKVAEKDALEILFDRVYTDLKNNYLWVMSQDIYRGKKDMFEVYFNSLCPCFTSKVSKTDMMEKFLEVQKRCNYELTTDTIFLNKLKTVAGGTTLKELYDVANYLAMYMYGNCDILYYRFNETIKSTPVLEQYLSGINFLKSREGEAVIRYFKAKQPDSLSLIFPGYKKYSSEFEKITTNTDAKTVTTRGYFISQRQGGLPTIYVRFYKNKEDYNPFARAEMTVSDISLKSKIISIKYYKEKPVKEGEIMERVVEQ
jgi:hypothetical protein